MSFSFKWTNVCKYVSSSTYFHFLPFSPCTPNICETFFNMCLSTFSSWKTWPGLRRNRNQNFFAICLVFPLSVYLIIFLIFRMVFSLCVRKYSLQYLLGFISYSFIHWRETDSQGAKSVLV